MDEAKLLKIVSRIPKGQIIPGINKATKYIFLGLHHYNSHGKAPELDGSPIIILESEKRKRQRIIIFVNVLSYFLKDGRAFLSYGRLPPSYILEFRRGAKGSVPNLSQYESHYKSFARYVYTIAK
jgi:hypothetical protein